MAEAISLAAARAAVLQCAIPAGAVEHVGLAQAHGRQMAAAIVADGPWPATDRSAMDGFALLAGEAGVRAGTRLPVVGQSLAGAPFAGELPNGAAIRIMTGAVVPAGADAVVPVEQTSGFDGADVEVRTAVRAGQNVRLLGSEVAAGQQVIAAGRRIDAAVIGALAVLGATEVAVRRRPVVAIVATGDEVVPVERTPLPHQVRESNSWALAAQVAECGCTPLRLGIAPDERAGLRAMLSQGLSEADVLLTIGGVSKGTHDLVHGTLHELGVVEVFHGIHLKPGKPTFFGRRDAASGAQFVFGLPGNPASAFTVFELLVRPLLRRLLGDEPAPDLAELSLGTSLWKPNARLQAVVAQLVRGDGGLLQAALAAPSPSGDPFSLLAGDCLALVPPGARPGELGSAAVVAGARGVQLP